MGGKYDEDFGEEKKWDHSLNLCFELFDNSCVEKILLIVTVLKTHFFRYEEHLYNRPFVENSRNLSDLLNKTDIQRTQFSYPSP